MNIFFFSGTGNSFYVAKTLASYFSQSKVQSIAEYQNDDEINVSGEIIIVFPIYFYGIPHIVKKFLEHLNFADVKYLSFIFTAEYPNGIAVSTIQEICSKKNVIINSCFYLQMPTNYLIKSKMLESIEVEMVLNKADKKLDKIVKIIKDKKTYKEKDSKIYSLIVNAKKSHSIWGNAFPEFDSGFICSDDCNGCRLCEINCPVGNIEVKTKPIWNNRCEACLKCINICPRQSIQYDNKTEGRRRYFNPKVKINEFK
jgi:ferredoxin